MKKPIRTLSGVSPVAVMSDAPCPGNCIYCPGESAKSYLDAGPVPARAKHAGFDPYLQTRQRIEHLLKNGHPSNKVELIIMGGTLPAQGWEYQVDFVKRCLDAMNNTKSSNLHEAQGKNETADHRCVGMTIETRPDYCPVEQLLELGVTRVELGVQVPDDTVYLKVNRGHSVADVVRATEECKRAGLKVCYHLMPGLPGSSLKKDTDAFRQVFEDPKFRPDMIKFYPCLVVPGTKLFEMWKSGEYAPPTTEQMIEFLARVKATVPPWVRIMRVHRDFPVEQVAAGVRCNNLRELVWGRMVSNGTMCRCIRCREVMGGSGNPHEEVLEYDASGGKEVFISWEEPLVGFLRLRLDETATVRELHVYGPEVKVGGRGAWQHRGFGKKLMEKAEDVASAEGYKRLRVLSGIGAREYYRKLGYKMEKWWMVKALA